MSSYSIQYDAKELNAWFDDPTRRPRIRSAFEKIGVDGENKLKKEAESISTSGKLHNSIQYKFSQTASNMSVRIIATAAYSGVALETGRKPGKMPPPKALQRWVRLKGLGLMSVATSGKSRSSFGSQRKFTKAVSSVEESIAFLIARKIAKEGTQKFRQKGPRLLSETFDFVMDNVVPKRMSQILDAY